MAVIHLPAQYTHFSMAATSCLPSTCPLLPLLYVSKTLHQNVSILLVNLSNDLRLLRYLMKHSFVSWVDFFGSNSSFHCNETRTAARFKNQHSELGWVSFSNPDLDYSIKIQVNVNPAQHLCLVFPNQKQIKLEFISTKWMWWKKIETKT